MFSLLSVGLAPHQWHGSIDTTQVYAGKPTTAIPLGLAHSLKAALGRWVSTVALSLVHLGIPRHKP